MVLPSNGERSYGKVKVIPSQAYGAQGFWEVKASRFRDIGVWRW
jgi:hypothetical protein